MMNTFGGPILYRFEASEATRRRRKEKKAWSELD